MSDTLTILTSLDRPCTKSFELHNGEMRQRSLGMPFQFDVREQAITGLDDLSQALGALETDSQVGPVTLSCRPRCSFKPPFVRRRQGFSSPELSGGVADCRSR